MADMHGFGQMDPNDRGEEHEFSYRDDRAVPASSGPTPSQTVGPFFAYGLTPGSYGYPHKDVHSATIEPTGESDTTIMVEGQVFDGEGQPVHDALIEIVQADGLGRYATETRNDSFTGYARCGTGAGGPASAGGDTHFRFRTIKPGSTASGSAPFITIIVTMRGLLNHCVTRLYFPGDDHAADPVLRQVLEARRGTLIAQKTAPDRYRFDIHMQGDAETVFFDL